MCDICAVPYVSECVWVYAQTLHNRIRIHSENVNDVQWILCSRQIYLNECDGTSEREKLHLTVMCCVRVRHTAILLLLGVILQLNRCARECYCYNICTFTPLCAYCILYTIHWCSPVVRPFGLYRDFVAWYTLHTHQDRIVETDFYRFFTLSSTTSSHSLYLPLSLTRLGRITALESMHNCTLSTMANIEHAHHLRDIESI